ncbi:neuroglian-like, partial [Sitodiplosis mosellana]|uniref:neuroglian-like n=1 Tax=Sitodiplosis mosellana TaxID=263140 RepID=UPI002443913A
STVSTFSNELLIIVPLIGTIFPKFTKQPPKEELLHKGDTIVPCEAEGNNITYYWKRDGAEFDWTKLRTDANSGSITIDKPGQYQCFAKNENGIASSSTVTFLARGKEPWIYPPGVPLVFDTIITRVKENEPAVLKCEPPFSRPSTIRWEHINAEGLGEPINDSRMTTGPDGYLYISNINQKDNSSKFKCESTPFEHDKRYLLAVPFLHVVPNPVPPPKWPILQYAQRNVVAVASKSIEMFCIFGGTPEPT